MNAAPDAASAWPDALWVAVVWAVDPHGLGGVALRAGAGPVRDAWCAAARGLLPPAAPWRRLPTHISDDRLLGGLDLAATLQAARPVAQRGLLAESDGGVVVIAMAERLSAATAARLAGALDRGEVGFERDGIGQRWASRIGVVALDEGRDDDPALPVALADRLAFQVDLSTVAWGDMGAAPLDAAQVLAARTRLGGVQLPEAVAQALCATALRLGVASLRASLWACRAARAVAALHGRDSVIESDAQLAARLVLAPRATVAPAAAEPPSPENTTPDTPAEPETPDTADPADTAPPQPPPAPAVETPPAADEAPPPPAQENAAQALEDRLIAATQAALPAGLLAALLNGEGARGAGRVGAWSKATRGGRPLGARAGEPRGGARLNLIETLRAAAPWQRLRAAEAAAAAAGTAAAQLATHQVTQKRPLTEPQKGPQAKPQTDPQKGPQRMPQQVPLQVPQRVHIRAADLRVSRLQQRAATATLFVIDASGSSALHRLAEAKGAVNLLLAECYVRRDQVGVIAFRGRAAEVLLPPTRSLVRARRSLAELPGGGGTPLAAGLQAALVMAGQVRRAGAVPVVVLLTDGRANVALDGAPGRVRAEADALQMARQLRAARLTLLLVDTSSQASPAAQRLAQALAAPYRVLPHAGAAELNAAVRALPRQAG